MRVLALGGYGRYGPTAVRLLAESDLVTEIAVAGRTVERAEEAAAEIGDKATAVRVDGTDEEQLTSLLAGYDIVVETATAEAVVPTIRAAMRAGVHCCGVSGFGDVLAQALELDAEARAAGITAIIDVGCAPGFTNLMGVHAAGQLDDVEQVQGGWIWIWRDGGAVWLTPDQWSADPRQSLAVIQQFRPYIGAMLRNAHESGSATVRAYRDGQWADVDPVRSGVEVPVLPSGTVTAYPYHSGVPLLPSMPRNLGSVRPVQVRFSPLPPQLHDLLREQALRTADGVVDGESALTSFYETIASDPDRWLTLPDGFVAPPSHWVTAVGRKGGRAARSICWLTPAIWAERMGVDLTAAPLVAAVLSILRGDMRERGVMLAETAFEPLPFFGEVARLLPEPPPDGELVGESFEWLE